LQGWPENGNFSLDTIRKMPTTISKIRKDIDVKRNSLLMVVHDDNGGTSGAAVFLTLLGLLEQVDEAMSSIDSQNDNAKESPIIDIFRAVNIMRRKRMKMIQNFEEYVFLFKCVVYYIHHKEDFAQNVKLKDTPLVGFTKEDTSNHSLTNNSKITESATEENENIKDGTPNVITTLMEPFRHTEGKYLEDYQIYK
jgi:hypothetical protein